MAKALKLLCFLCCFLCLVGLVQAQQSAPPVRFVTLATNTTRLGRLTNIPNIGQQTHVVIVTVSNNTGGTGCVNGWGGLLQLEASIDGVTWFQIGSPLPPASHPPPATIATSAVGAYPFLAVNYISGQTLLCALTITYVGYSGAAPFPSVPSSFQDSFSYASGVMVDNPTADIGPTCFNGTTAVLYSAVITNLEMTFVPLTLGIYSGGFVPLDTLAFTLAPGGSLVLPPGPRPYLRGLLSAPATDVEGAVLSTTSGPAGVNIGFSGSVRCEN